MQEEKAKYAAQQGHIKDQCTRVEHLQRELADAQEQLSCFNACAQAACATKQGAVSDMVQLRAALIDAEVELQKATATAKVCGCVLIGRTLSREVPLLQGTAAGESGMYIHV